MLKILTKVREAFLRGWRGCKGFVSRKGVGFTIVTGLFALLVLANGAYALWEASYHPGFCSLCHIIRPYVDSYYTSHHTDNIHYQAHVVCKDCHVVGPGEALQEVWSYVTGNYDNPLPEKRVSKETCLHCHRSYEALAQDTAHLERNPHAGHWPEMECNLCHKAHRPSVDYCGQCHASGHTIQP